MTINDAIARADAIRPNAVPLEQKTKMLFGLEANVAERMGVEIKPPHVNLLMPPPRDEMYVWYLCAMIDLAQEETTLYQDDMTVANNTIGEALRWWQRTHDKEKSLPFEVL